MKRKSLLIIILAFAFFLVVLGGVVFAQGEVVPPPYTGVTNPFSWGDASAITAGDTIYQSKCKGCHGIDGSGIPGADFSSSDFSIDLKTRPDYYFWRLSEGNLSNGMPAFKASRSENERWQLLTYIQSLGSTTVASNPFTWGDSSAISAGKIIYANKCQSCHGIDGSGIPGADFSSSVFSIDLKTRPEYYFSQLSEGVLSKGMPAFKSSLSENERWQLLTYVQSLGDTKPEPIENFTLSLQIPDEADSGQLLIIQASLKDKDGNPVSGAVVKYFINLQFFTSGSMEIGETLTDNEGNAILEYIPRHTGEVEVKVSYRNTKAAKTIKFPEAGKVFYMTHVGLDNVPSIGENTFIGPKRPPLLLSEAPKTVFRLPNGQLFWLAPFLLVVITIWSTYFFIWYQVYRIPATGEIGETDTRRIPLMAMIIVTIIGTGLVLMLVTGPISNP